MLGFVKYGCGDFNVDFSRDSHNCYQLLCIVIILLELILVLIYIIHTEGKITLLPPGPITSSHCNIMCI